MGRSTTITSRKAESSRTRLSTPTSSARRRSGPDSSRSRCRTSSTTTSTPKHVEGQDLDRTGKVKLNRENNWSMHFDIWVRLQTKTIAKVEMFELLIGGASTS